MQTILIRVSPIRFNRRVDEVMMHLERKELWPVPLLLLLVRNGWYIGAGTGDLIQLQLIFRSGNKIRSLGLTFRMGTFIRAFSADHLFTFAHCDLYALALFYFIFTAQHILHCS